MLLAVQRHSGFLHQADVDWIHGIKHLLMLLILHSSAIEKFRKYTLTYRFFLVIVYFRVVLFHFSITLSI